MEHPRRFSKKGPRPAAAIADLSTTGAAGRVYAGIDIRRGRFGFFCGHKATKRPPYQTEWPVDLRGPYGPSVYPSRPDISGRKRSGPRFPLPCPAGAHTVPAVALSGGRRDPLVPDGGGAVQGAQITEGHIVVLAHGNILLLVGFQRVRRRTGPMCPFPDEKNRMLRHPVSMI